MIARLEAVAAQRIRDHGHAILVGAHGDERALVVELLLEDHDFTLDLVARGLDHVHAFVQDHFLPGAQRLRFERGAQVHLHLAALGQHVHRAVLVGREVEAVDRRGGAELLDLFLQRGDLVTRHGERLHELLLRRGLGRIERFPAGGWIQSVHVTLSCLVFLQQERQPPNAIEGLGPDAAVQARTVCRCCFPRREV
jgi:hypothetical protein